MFLKKLDFSKEVPQVSMDQRVAKLHAVKVEGPKKDSTTRPVESHIGGHGSSLG